mgnify:FL=1
MVLDPYGEAQPSGLGRAIFEMAKAIAAQGADSYITYLKRTHGYSWLRRGSLDPMLDLYIFFTPVIPYFFKPKKSIVVAHDFAYLETPGVRALLIKHLHSRSLRKATAIVAVSEQTKREIVRLFRIPERKITVVPNGSVPLPAPQALQTPEHFFLFAGVLKERKNVLGIIRAFAEFAPAHPGFFLLLAGKKQGAYYEQALRLVEDLGLKERARFLGYVTDGELAYLYTKAEALVFPSFIEGFGMPVLEAFALGLPVITSKSGALAEVAGDAALLVDPQDPSDIARAMARLAADRGLHRAYSTKGFERAKAFSWEKTGRDFNALISSI